MSKMELTKEEEEQLQQDIMTHLDSCPEDLIDELCQVVVDYKMEEDVAKELDIDHNYISECWRREGEKNIIKKYFNARIIEEKAKLSGGYQYTHFLQQELDHLLFRNLDEKEKKGFRQWARDNFKISDTIKTTWHPVVQEECKKIIEESKRR